MTYNPLKTIADWWGVIAGGIALVAAFAVMRFRGESNAADIQAEQQARIRGDEALRQEMKDMEARIEKAREQDEAHRAEDMKRIESALSQINKNILDLARGK